MAENNASDVRLNTNSNGMVYFASDVVATIAGLAVTEVEGVANTVGTSGRSYRNFHAPRAVQFAQSYPRHQGGNHGQCGFPWM